MSVQPRLWATMAHPGTRYLQKKSDRRKFAQQRIARLIAGPTATHLVDPFESDFCQVCLHLDRRISDLFGARVIGIEVRVTMRLQTFIDAIDWLAVDANSGSRRLGSMRSSTAASHVRDFGDRILPGARARSSPQIGRTFTMAATYKFDYHAPRGWIRPRARRRACVFAVLKRRSVFLSRLFGRLLNTRRSGARPFKRCRQTESSL